MEHPTKYNFARDGFIYLLSYATLVITSVSVNFLAKALVNRWIPDAVSNEFLAMDSAIIGFLAAAVIALPVFIYLSYLANKMLGAKTMRADSGVRHWLIYITLVVVILIIIWQLAVLFFSFLNGTLILQFGVHTLITLIIAGLILWYQWWHLKFFAGEPKKLGVGFKVFEWTALAVIIAIISWTFTTIASPAEQRAKNLDKTRVERLTYIRDAVQSFYGFDKISGHLRLPQSLAELEKDARVYLPGDGLVDPVTKEQFAYRVINKTTYELCAAFDTEFKEASTNAVPAPESVPDSRMKMFYHGIGTKCFELKVG
ncbi:MAG: hypothetical protein VE98_C0001G0188 [candidate division Kazan bacterium GW2011_GWA1_50_15]|uniref:DUF5671 domain-containing protein n=2 Tax=Bacteria division Kazan-3B-28 TaxID=1798534 RepID=A0A0G1ZG14_UNCK3|nr:MAG: hypothetical protein VE98_C0001G0188 [candidate division Kazan bacterium GW2011_GWA1_50_15]KKW25536.1 MAG: hypothetical protein VE99_C0001G0173 [candidate division Kazan bacterium GW2011_GWC1_52_13]KKW26842.1 MAG: hypothetical protein VF00_C0002G0167 [candidate division Kazan bacterium GW2011_GWB1_52_7]HAV65835.1 hypothetical protein [Patescibacteria group bacterium]HCR42754.1 hypothetical protein [Patescibacteria group bacterium]